MTSAKKEAVYIRVLVIIYFFEFLFEFTHLFLLDLQKPMFLNSSYYSYCISYFMNDCFFIFLLQRNDFCLLILYFIPSYNLCDISCCTKFWRGKKLKTSTSLCSISVVAFIKMFPGAKYVICDKNNILKQEEERGDSNPLFSAWVCARS